MSPLRRIGKIVFTWYTKGKRGRSHYVFVVDNCWHPWGLWISSEYYISKSHLGLNISIKLNKLLIDAFVIFSSPHRPFETSFHKMTVGRRPLRGGGVTTSITRQALTWNPQGKRKRGQLRNSWRRDTEAELKQQGTNWTGAARLAHNRERWRGVVDGLCSARSHGPS